MYFDENLFQRLQQNTEITNIVIMYTFGYTKSIINSLTRKFLLKKLFHSTYIHMYAYEEKTMHLPASINQNFHILHNAHVFLEYLLDS